MFTVSKIYIDIRLVQVYCRFMNLHQIIKKNYVVNFKCILLCVRYSFLLSSSFVCLSSSFPLFWFFLCFLYFLFSSFFILLFLHFFFSFLLVSLLFLSCLPGCFVSMALSVCLFLYLYFFLTTLHSSPSLLFPRFLSQPPYPFLLISLSLPPLLHSILPFLSTLPWLVIR